jgi:hypothetical protein
MARFRREHDMPRLGKVIKGKRYQVGRFAGKWYVADLSGNRFIYGPFARRETAEARIRRLTKRITNPKWFPVTKKKAKRLGEKYRKAFHSFTRENPKRGTLIYGRVLKIFAQKTSGPYKGQRFVHTFKRGAIMLGMPDGSLRIVHP